MDSKYSQIYSLLMNIIIIEITQIRASKKRKFKFIIARFSCMNLVFWSWWLKRKRQILWFKKIVFWNFIFLFNMWIDQMKWTVAQSVITQCFCWWSDPDQPCYHSPCCLSVSWFIDGKTMNENQSNLLRWGQKIN